MTEQASTGKCCVAICGKIRRVFVGIWQDRLPNAFPRLFQRNPALSTIDSRPSIPKPSTPGDHSEPQDSRQVVTGIDPSQRRSLEHPRGPPPAYVPLGTLSHPRARNPEATSTPGINITRQEPALSNRVTSSNRELSRPPTRRGELGLRSMQSQQTINSLPSYETFDSEGNPPAYLIPPRPTRESTPMAEAEAEARTRELERQMMLDRGPASVDSRNLPSDSG